MSFINRLIKNIVDIWNFLKNHRLKKNIARLFSIGFLFLAFFAVSINLVKGTSIFSNNSKNNFLEIVEAENRDLQSSKTKSKSSKSSTKKTDKSAPKPTVMRKPINWQKPSQTTPYPVIKDHPNLEIKVSLKKQRVYLIDGGQKLYSMYASSGMDNSTPTGTFHILERGYTFFKPDEQMGANYWTDFLGTKYLFHSVPTDKEGNYIVSETKDLGKKPSSHGCIRLSVPDALWIYKNVPRGTKVTITKL